MNIGDHAPARGILGYPITGYALYFHRERLRIRRARAESAARDPAHSPDTHGPRRCPRRIRTSNRLLPAAYGAEWLPQICRSAGRAGATGVAPAPAAERVPDDPGDLTSATPELAPRGFLESPRESSPLQDRPIPPGFTTTPAQQVLRRREYRAAPIHVGRYSAEKACSWSAG